MQVALVLMAYLIELAFEIYSYWFLPNCTLNTWLPIQIAAIIILTKFILNEWSACALN